jgi:hypothetical protein
LSVCHGRPGAMFMSVVERLFWDSRSSMMLLLPSVGNLFMTLYARRAGNAELTGLKISDVEASGNTLAQLRRASLCADEGPIEINRLQPQRPVFDGRAVRL